MFMLLGEVCRPQAEIRSHQLVTDLSGSTQKTAERARGKDVCEQMRLRAKYLAVSGEIRPRQDDGVLNEDGL